MTDPNGNRTELAFDALGFLVGTALRGKATETVGDSLAGFTADLDDATAQAHIAAPLASPDAVLGDATSRLVYDLHAFFRTKSDPEPQPALVYTLSRETHASELEPGELPPYQHVFSYSDGFAHEVQRRAFAPPDAGPRWIGSAWTIFDNKGNSVRTYEPFYSPTHHFEFAHAVGVATTLLYDPARRLVGTLHPDGTWSKDVFGPWRRETWDTVDTSAMADPRTDTDVGDHMKRVIGSGAFISWHDARIGGTLGSTPEQRAANKDAAEKSSANAATPTVAHFDARDRTVLTVADDGPAGRLGDRLAYDAAGRAVALTDPLGRRAEEWCLREPQGGGGFLYVSGWGISGDLLYANTIDGGERRMLASAASKAYRTWDARGHAFRVVFDGEQRITHLYVRPGGGTEILLERSVYGEGQPADRNLAGKLYRHYDSGGLRACERYDFKGNVVESARVVASEYRKSTDWKPIEAATTVAALDAGAAPLLGERFTSTTIHDARDREIQTVTFHNGTMKPNVIRTGYDESGCVKRIDVWTQRSSAPTALLDPTTADLQALVDATYNARLQRLSEMHGNGVISTHEYDPQTFRIARILTTRPSSFPVNERVLQDLSYTYDAVGNVTRIRDDADIHNVVFFQNQRVDPTADYTYDPLYRLVRATGREHLGQNPAPQQTSDDDSTHTGLPHPGDGLAMATYTETYTYDAGANHLSVAHQAGAGGWTRRYAYSAPSRVDAAETGNRVSATSVPGDPVAGPYSAKYEYDEHGNTTRMPHLPALAWDERDRLRSTTRQVVNAGVPETAYNVYGSDGIRVRHVLDRQAASVDAATPRSARLYLGAVEVYRELGNDGVTVELERETLHVPGLPERTAIVETRTHGSDRSAAARDALPARQPSRLGAARARRRGRGGLLRGVPPLRRDGLPGGPQPDGRAEALPLHGQGARRGERPLLPRRPLLRAVARPLAQLRPGGMLGRVECLRLLRPAAVHVDGPRRQAARRHRGHSRRRHRADAERATSHERADESAGRQRAAGRKYLAGDPEEPRAASRSARRPAHRADLGSGGRRRHGLPLDHADGQQQRHRLHRPLHGPRHGPGAEVPVGRRASRATRTARHTRSCTRPGRRPHPSSLRRRRPTSTRSRRRSTRTRGLSTPPARRTRRTRSRRRRPRRSRCRWRHASCRRRSGRSSTSNSRPARSSRPT